LLFGATLYSNLLILEVDNLEYHDLRCCTPQRYRTPVSRQAPWVPEKGALSSTGTDEVP
jgi:hypothetical protein